jgi:hypothetical protein
MHDSLHLRNVSKLPESIRVIFLVFSSVLLDLKRFFQPTALAAASGSLNDFMQLSIAIVHPDSDLRTQPAAIFALPVLYLHLDPSTIPTPDALDNAARPTCIDAACTACRRLATSRICPYSQIVSMLAGTCDSAPGPGFCSSTRTGST